MHEHEIEVSGDAYCNCEDVYISRALLRSVMTALLNGQTVTLVMSEDGKDAVGFAVGFR